MRFTRSLKLRVLFCVYLQIMKKSNNTRFVFQRKKARVDTIDFDNERHAKPRRLPLSACIQENIPKFLHAELKR